MLNGCTYSDILDENIDGAPSVKSSESIGRREAKTAISASLLPTPAMRGGIRPSTT